MSVYSYLFLSYPVYEPIFTGLQLGKKELHSVFIMWFIAGLDSWTVCVSLLSIFPSCAYLLRFCMYSTGSMMTVLITDTRVLQGACCLVWPVEFWHQMSPDGGTGDIWYISVLACVCVFVSWNFLISTSVCFHLIAFVFSFPALVAFPPPFFIPLFSFCFCHNSLLPICRYFCK